MLLKKKLLNASSLYLILDRQVNSYDELYDIALQAIDGGVNVLQIRDKSGSDTEISKFVARIIPEIPNDVLFIVNDRAHLVSEVQAHGVHLGQEDMCYSDARTIVGPDVVIGVSCQTKEQALEAQLQGADYIGFGSVFKTLTKPERNPMDLNLLKDVVASLSIPVFAIGGIDLERAEKLLSIGVRHMAVCRAISQSKNVTATARQFSQMLSVVGSVKE